MWNLVQGWFKSCLVDSELYLLTVLRYIALNPVRAAAVVALPEDYRRWSVHTHLRMANDPLLTPHPACLQLGGDLATCAFAYRAWLRQAIDEERLASIRRHLSQERALGDVRFQAMVDRALNRPAACCPRGRPAKVSLTTD